MVLRLRDGPLISKYPKYPNIVNIVLVLRLRDDPLIWRAGVPGGPRVNALINSGMASAWGPGIYTIIQDMYKQDLGYICTIIQDIRYTRVTLDYIFSTM